ncbi:FAD:protein FMN transferase [Streptomyces sp. NPDC007264]|uniref:FAD:protein FMN transferase n=1 Tax=Streptomyces sp. NPDC007264 TaxID=3364777 RepID=UPI0036DB8FFD
MSGSARPAGGVAPLPGVARAEFRALGTVVTLLVADPAALEEARGLLDAELAAIDLACSRFREDSELSALNRADGRPLRVSGTFVDALAVALDAAAATDGDVDPTCGGVLVDLGYDRDFTEVARDGSRAVVTARPVPGWRVVELDAEAGVVRVPAGLVLDLGATAKALAADRAAARIHAAVGCGVLVNLGGDISVAGPAPDDGWRILVTDGTSPAGGGTSPAGEDPDPARSGAPHRAVAITEGGLATSGTGVRRWRRGRETVHHIVSPHTGECAPSSWQTVTVAASTCVGANTASTAAVVRGEAAVEWLEGLAVPALLVRPDGRATVTGAWPHSHGTTG